MTIMYYMYCNRVSNENRWRLFEVNILISDVII